MNGTLISIVIPCRNEEKYVARCLETVLAFELPGHVTTEVFIMDGQSTDATREIVSQVAAQNSRVKLRPNPGRIQSTAMNLALKEAGGEWIMRLDAHSTYPRDYLRLCLETAMRTKAQNVGGLFITQPGGSSYQARLVQALTTHRFGVGNSGFRLGEGEAAADTVPYGFFRREIFERIGLIDERLVRAQDYEFNRRIIACGGVVWRNPNIHVHYYNQPTLAAFFRKQVVREAPYNVYLWYVAPYAFAVRHAVTGVFALGVLGGAVLAPLSWWIAAPYLGVLALYALLAVASAVQQAVRFRDLRHVVCLPPNFFLYHFLHGLGILWGAFRLLTRTAPVQPLGEPWKGAGVSRIRPSPRFNE